MWRVDGFKTKEEAEKYRKTFGGYVSWEERTPKRKILTSRGKEYMFCTRAAGMNREKNPYIVTRRI